ncbi:MAG: hypothetical protein ACHQ06_03590 [Candidatus Dormibacteria bacterium]
MTGENRISVDRPAPGHYQGRLSTVLSRLPAWLPPPSAQASPRAPGSWSVGHGTRRSRQLALPLDPR